MLAWPRGPRCPSGTGVPGQGPLAETPRLRSGGGEGGEAPGGLSLAASLGALELRPHHTWIPNSHCQTQAQWPPVTLANKGTSFLWSVCTQNSPEGYVSQIPLTF